MSDFKQGDEVYLDNGSECDYIAKVDGGHVVNLIYMDEAGTSEPIFTRNVFSKPPTEKYDRQIDGIKKDIERLQNERTNLVASKTDLTHELYDVQERAKSIDALKHVFDFIDGKITHYVEGEYFRFKITERSGVADKQHDRDYEKLLTLFGRTDGDLSWRLNQYSDGSGCTRRVYPCQSIEEAQAKVVELCDAVFLDYRDGNKRAGIRYAASSLEAIHHPVPKDISDTINAAEIKNKVERIQKQKLEWQKEIELLDELKNKTT